MGYRYTNEIEGGQVIESDDLVPHLEGQALWVREVIGDPDPALVPSTSAGVEGTPFMASTAPVFTSSADEGSEDESDDESASEDETEDQDEDQDEVIGDPDPALVPSEDWTDERLDALAKDRGITFRANTKKATKVAKLTAPTK